MNKKTKKLLIISGVVAVVLGLLVSLGIGGYIGYTQWYLPKITQEYRNATQEDYQSINDSIDNLKSNYRKLHNYHMTGEVYEAEEIDEIVNKQLEETNKSIEKVDGILSNLPEAKSTTKEVDSNLRDYYTKTEESLSEYKDILEYYKSIVPKLKTYESISDYVMNDLLVANNISGADDLQNAAKKLRENADKLEKARKDLPKDISNNLIKDYNDYIILVFESTESYFKEAASAYEKMKKGYDKRDQTIMMNGYNDANDADTNFSKNIEKIDKKNKENDKNIRDHFDEIIDDLEAKQDDINDQYEDLIEQYSLEE